MRPSTWQLAPSPKTGNAWTCILLTVCELPNSPKIQEILTMLTMGGGCGTLPSDLSASDDEGGLDLLQMRFPSGRASMSRQVGCFFFCEHRVSGCLQSERKIITMPFA